MAQRRAAILLGGGDLTEPIFMTIKIYVSRDDRAFVLGLYGGVVGTLVNWPTAIEGLLTPDQIVGVVLFLGFVVWTIGAVYVLLNEDAGVAIRL